MIYTAMYFVNCFVLLGTVSLCVCVFFLKKVGVV